MYSCYWTFIPSACFNERFQRFMVETIDKISLLVVMRKHITYCSWKQKRYNMLKLLYLLRTSPTWRHTALMTLMIKEALEENQWIHASFPVFFGGLDIRNLFFLRVNIRIVEKNHYEQFELVLDWNVSRIYRLQSQRDCLWISNTPWTWKSLFGMFRMPVATMYSLNNPVLHL